jgi:hypothetical protein
MKALNYLNCLIQRTVTSERHFAPSHPVSGYPGGSPDGYRELLVVLWSGNDNELYQLQVHIFSVIHVVHLFITKVWGEKDMAIRGLSKLNIIEQNCT